MEGGGAVIKKTPTFISFVLFHFDNTFLLSETKMLKSWRLTTKKSLLRLQTGWYFELI